MTMLGIATIMVGGMLIWAGLTDNSIIELLKGIFSKPKQSKPTNPSNPVTATGGGGGGGHGGKH